MLAKLLTEYESFLPTLFGVSEVSLKTSRPQDLKASVEKADGTKCERCWRYVPEVSAKPGPRRPLSALRRSARRTGEPVVLASRRLEVIVAVTVVILDQITKAMVRPALTLHESIEVIPGFLDLTRVHNTGAAFGMLNSVDFPFKTVVLSLVAAIALGGVAWYAATVPLSDRLARVGIAGVLGGAVGNLIDRASSGYVLDFVDAYWNGWHFWAFNVADAAITVGVIFMILDILGLGRSRASNPV